MKKDFELLKTEFAKECKKYRPCSSEYSRLLNAKNEAEVLKVIFDNISWCVTNKVITTEFFNQFDKETFINSGIANTGQENTGFINSGNWNSGYRNSGYRNSGDSNSGNRNSGNWNSGDSNSGDSNSGYRNSGAFCTDNDPVLYLFNKPTKIRVREWENHKAVSLMYGIDFTLWIPKEIMTDEEKKAYPKYETTEGYLKTIPPIEAWSNFWHNLTEDNKKVFTTLPNFDAKIFEEITGIKI